MSNIDRHDLDEDLARRSTFKQAPSVSVEALPDRTPQITEAIVKENLRRVRSSPAFVTEHPDGTRSYVHDAGVQRDVLISTVSTERSFGASSISAGATSATAARTASGRSRARRLR